MNGTLVLNADKETDNSVLAQVKYWVVRVYLLLKTQYFGGQPMSMRVIEFFSQLVFRILGSTAHVSDNFSRSNWNLLHGAFVAKGARSDNNVHVRDVFLKSGNRVRIYKPSTALCHQKQSRFPEFGHRLICFLHGGGFCLNAVDTLPSHNFCYKLAAIGFVVAAVDYRLAPEHPFPHALEDSLDFLRWCTCEESEKYGLNQKEIILVGESAGGNLAAVASSLIRDKLDAHLSPTNDWDGVKVLHQVILYGCFFVTPLMPSMQHLIDETRHYYFLSKPVVEFFFNAYIPVFDREILMADRRVAPFLAGLEDLPSTTIFCGSDDPLYDENVLYASSLMNCSLHQFEGTIHGFMTFDNLPEAGDGFNLLANDLEFLLIHQGVFKSNSSRHHPRS